MDKVEAAAVVLLLRGGLSRGGAARPSWFNNKSNFYYKFIRGFRFNGQIAVETLWTGGSPPSAPTSRVMVVDGCCYSYSSRGFYDPESWWRKN